MEKCKGLLREVGSALGDVKHVFWDPVEPKVLPDYYAIIKDPVFFGKIEKCLSLSSRSSSRPGAIAHTAAALPENFSANVLNGKRELLNGGSEDENQRLRHLVANVGNDQSTMGQL